MLNESTESRNFQKISFSFEHHRQTLKQNSAELYQALRLMTWRAKSTILASDQGLNELTSNFSSSQNSLKSSVLFSLLLGCVLFSTTTGLLYLIEVKDARVKWPISAFFFLLGFALGLLYFLYFLKRQKIARAVSDLSNSFQKDV
jgi:hypothetical protein